MPSTPSDKARVAARRLKVLNYVKAGLSFREIAERLSQSDQKISHVQCFKDFQAVMNSTVLATEMSKAEMVALESERIEMARTALLTSVLKGNLGAIKMWLEASKNFRKLHGLDKPIQIEDVTKAPLPIDLNKLSLVKLRILEELLLEAQAATDSEVGEIEDEDETDD